MELGDALIAALAEVDRLTLVLHESDARWVDIVNRNREVQMRMAAEVLAQEVDKLRELLVEARSGLVVFGQLATQETVARIDAVLVEGGE